MTFGRVAEALPGAIRLVGWPKLVIFFFFFRCVVDDNKLVTAGPHRSRRPGELLQMSEPEQQEI